MAHHPRWKDLIIGIVASLAVVGVALAILIYGRVGRLHGKTITVYVTTDAARGVITGTEVWLDGQKIGLVKNISFRPPDIPPKERLVIALTVLDKVRPQLRLDSGIDIRAGGNLIGDQVVYLNSGSAKMRAVANGDTIHGGAQADVQDISAEMSLATKEFPGIIENVKLLAAQLHTAQGTLGALGIETGSPQLELVRIRSTRLMNRAASSHGTIGLAMGGSGLLQSRAAETMARVDSIKALVMSNEHSFGRFRRDSTLIIEMGRIRDELAEVQRLANSPAGTVGRARADSVIARNIHQTQASMDSLFVDLKKHPFRYLVF